MKDNSKSYTEYDAYAGTAWQGSSTMVEKAIGLLRRGWPQRRLRPTDSCYSQHPAFGIRKMKKRDFFVCGADPVRYGAFRDGEYIYGSAAATADACLDGILKRFVPKTLADLLVLK